MKKALLFLGLIAVFTAKSQVFVENFTTPPFTADGLVIGTNGWVEGPLNGASATKAKVVSGSLTYINYPGSGIGNTAYFPTNDNVAANTYSNSNPVTIGGNSLVVPAVGGAMYAAFLVKISGSSRTTHNDFFAFENITGSVQRGRILAKGANSSANFNLAFSKASASSVTLPYVTYNSNANLNPANTYLLVMKYEVVTGIDNDILTLYINPDPTKIESEQTDKLIATDAQTDLTIAAVTRISMRQRGVQANVGGIRVGYTWADVVMPTVTKLATPTLKKPNVISKSGFRAYWNAVANTSSYDVKVFDGASQVGATLNTTSTSLAITGLSANTTYTYKVTAKGTGNYSDSDESFASTSVTTLTSDKDYVLSQYSTSDVADLKSDLVAGYSEIYELTTSGGAYQFSSSDANNIVLSKSATLRAQSGLANKPLISINNSNTTATSNIFAINAADVILRLEGLEFNGVNANTSGTPIQNILIYGLLTNSTNAAIIVRDCYIHDFKNASTYGTFRLDEAGSSIDIQGSAMRNCTGRVINFYTVSKVYGNVTLKNSTLSNIGADESTTGGFLFFRSASPNVVAGTTVTIEHCTFDTYTSSANEIFRFNANVMSGLISVKNSIFTNIARGLSYTNPNGFVIDECYIGGFATAVTNATNRTITNTIATAPTYTNSGSNDFTLTNKSALICNNGYVAGNTYGAVLTPLTATTALPATVISSTGFTANWLAKANASGYIVNVYDGVTLAKTTRVSAVTSTSFTDMTPDKAYTYKVIAVGDANTYSSSVESSASAEFTTTNNINLSGDISISALTAKSTSSIINVPTGATLTIDANTEVNAITAAPGAKVTLADTKTLSGALTLQSDETGTATFVDNKTVSPQAVTGTVQQRFVMTTARNWYMSTPIAVAAVPTGQTYYSYVEAGNNNDLSALGSLYWKPEAAGNPINPAKGYIAPISSTSTMEFNGTFNTGQYTVALTRSPGKLKEGFNLVANPYPSYLDWSLVDTIGAKIMSSVWYRTKTSGNAYTFDTYNGGLNVATTNGANLVSKLIPPMQAFWVRVKSPETAGTLTFTNAMRKHIDNTSNKFKVAGNNTTDTKLVRLKVSNTKNSDETILCFNSNISDNYDSFDSPKMFNNTSQIPEIYTVVDAEKLVINGMRELKTNTEIPLGFVAGESNDFTIEATEFKNLDTDIRLILKDKQKNVEFELTENVAYHFNSEIVSASTNRFALIFRAQGVTTGVENTSKLNTQVFVNAANQITIIAPEKSKYAIYNAVGQLFAEGTINHLPLTINHSKGVYVVKVANVSTRVIIK